MKFNASIVVAVLCLASCSEPKTVTVNNVVQGNYKVVVRDLEFLHSGIHNTDICVTDLDDGDFPTTKGFQCFLRGYDFVGLTVSGGLHM